MSREVADVARALQTPLPEAAADPPEPSVSDTAALAHLRAFILDKGLKAGDRLPPERRLGDDLGLRRTELRRALEVLVDEGVLWRHVGKGTFLARPPAQSAQNDMEMLARRVSPADAMRARAAIEPAIAREAALHATAAAIAALRVTAARSREAGSWREYEALDTEFHRQIAQASGSMALLALFDQLNMLRRMVSWGRQGRQGAHPPADHPSFAEHDRIVDALDDRDPEAAHAAMRWHLKSVETRLDP
ncbi:MAG: FadR family transcriptional regulator [Paracoccaceae bacterium]|nr:MAG: FadR family transcriptional regulator [Paracoccaceae bacterium]